MSRERILERERRWALPVAIAAVLSTVFFIAAYAAQSQIPAEDSLGVQFEAVEEHHSALVAYSILAGLALAVTAAPLLYLFRAAQARSPRVQGALVAFCLLGPLLLGARVYVSGLGFGQVSSDYVDQAPSLESRTYDQFDGQLRRDPEAIDKVTVYTDAAELDVELTGGDLYTSEYPPPEEAALFDRLDARGVDSDEDPDGAGGDALAEQIRDDSSTVQVAGGLLLPAGLALIVAMIYAPLQAMRVGLLTRFFGSLGMALGVTSVIIPIVPPIVLGFWFGWLGLLILGKVPRGRPPAWDAGEAVPWPAPGEEGDDQPADGRTIEGTASEVGAQEGGGAGANAPRKRGERRKRKRRR